MDVSIADLQRFVDKGLTTQLAVDRALGKDPVMEAFTTIKPMRAEKLPNKTEQEFGRMLQARIDRGDLDGPLMFEPVKFRIAGNCYYTIDWGCRSLEIPFVGMPIFFEVKGAHIWDDSKVKFKAAKEMHQWARFEMWQKKKGEWKRIL
jgi:hypothetical protein